MNRRVDPQDTFIERRARPEGGFPLHRFSEEEDERKAWSATMTVFWLGIVVILFLAVVGAA